MTEPVPPRFQEELKTYGRLKDELLKLCEGKFALIRGSEFVGVFDTAGAAYNSGIDRFGNVSFLIKPVLRQERVEQIPALNLGLLHARI